VVIEEDQVSIFKRKNIEIPARYLTATCVEQEPGLWTNTASDAVHRAMEAVEHKQPDIARSLMDIAQACMQQEIRVRSLDIERLKAVTASVAARAVTLNNATGQEP